MSGMVLWLAQGLGVGRIPFAPGTFGSAVGLLWLLILMATGSFWLYLAGIIVGIMLSVWLCGVAEKILQQTDPSSVVLDEICAMPICFLAWVANDCFRKGRMPDPEAFFDSQNWIRTVLVFALFRSFDIVKPWPVRQSQKLRGGWGVTVDDVLAAVYVAALSLLFVR